MAAPSSSGTAIPPRTFYSHSSKNTGKYFDPLPNLCSRIFAGAVKELLLCVLLCKSVILRIRFQRIINNTAGIHRKPRRPYHIWYELPLPTDASVTTYYFQLLGPRTSYPACLRLTTATLVAGLMMMNTVQTVHPSLPQMIVTCLIKCEEEYDDVGSSHSDTGSVDRGYWRKRPMECCLPAFRHIQAARRGSSFPV